MIDYVTSHKDLGVIVTSKLLWAEHCSQLVSNASFKTRAFDENLPFYEQ